ncbi:hypothetical protein D9M69_531680 [compost metagenome]
MNGLVIIERINRGQKFGLCNLMTLNIYQYIGSIATLQTNIRINHRIVRCLYDRQLWIYMRSLTKRPHLARLPLFNKICQFGTIKNLHSLNSSIIRGENGTFLSPIYFFLIVSDSNSISDCPALRPPG